MSALVADCPNCKTFADGRAESVSDERHKVTVFTLNGVTHAAPSMWLAGATLGDGEPMPEAMARWAWHCGVEQQRAAQRLRDYGGGSD